MSGDEGETPKKGEGSTSKVIPEEPAALQELEERLLGRILRKVREESGSGERGEQKKKKKIKMYVDTPSASISWGLFQGIGLVGSLPKVR